MSSELVYRVSFSVDTRNTFDPNSGLSVNDEYPKLISGNLVAVDDDGNETAVGELTAHLLSTASPEDESELHVRADAQSQELCDVAAALFDSNGQLRYERLDHEFGLTDAYCHVELIEIDPNHRGKDLGLFMFSELINFLAGFGGGILISCLPCPSGADLTDEVREAGRKKLKRHWKRIGLKAVRGTNYLVGHTHRPIKNFYKV